MNILMIWDNYFTSIPLLAYFINNKILCFGTIRQNRLTPYFETLEGVKQFISANHTNNHDILAFSCSFSDNTLDNLKSTHLRIYNIPKKRAVLFASNSNWDQAIKMQFLA